MKWLFPLLVLAGSILFPAVLAEEVVNSSDEYVVREYALITFSDAVAPGEEVAGDGEKSVQVAGNTTRRGGEMTARKLFALKQAAREGMEKVAIPRDELLSNQSSAYDPANSQDCESGVCTKPTGYGTF